MPHIPVGLCSVLLAVAGSIVALVEFKGWLRIGLASLFAVLGIGEYIAIHQAEIDHQAEQVHNEGNLKYMQGQLDSINKVLGNVANNNSPQQTAALLRTLLPHIDTSGKSALEKMSNRDLRSRVTDFDKQLWAFLSKWNQVTENLSSQQIEEIRALPPNDTAKQIEVTQRGFQRMVKSGDAFILEFQQEFLGTGISYRDELIRRLGPQPVETGVDRPQALDSYGWIAPLSIGATARYLDKLARKLPD